ncbi:MAG TPA: protease complex subunit PrcB family protein [bacterium]|nr:protease complex subunit PrcB family protein [bacterium]
MNKKERIKIFLVGIITGLVLLTAVGFTNLGEITALFAPVRYLIKGEEVRPSDRSYHYFNGETYVPTSLIYAGTTYVPIRFVAETLGLKVDWNQDTSTIAITEERQPNGQAVYPRELLLTRLTKTSAPKEIIALLEYSLGTELAQSYTLGQNTYLIITRGMCPTGGYSVVIKQALETEDQLVVEVEYKDPAPDAIVTQAITYPYAVAMIEQTSKPVRFQGKEGTYLSQLHGLERMEPITAESKAIKLLTPASIAEGLTVRGVARVFEATVSWRLLDQKREERKSGFVTAARGGPDWGYFSFDLEQQYLGAGYKLQVYEQSAEDGSAINVVEIPLDQYAGLAQG